MSSQQEKKKNRKIHRPLNIVRRALGAMAAPVSPDGGCPDSVGPFEIPSPFYAFDGPLRCA